MLERELGRGGMAFVFLARDEKLGRHVAIKVLRPELSAVLGADRFHREIALTARLSHPRIVAIYDSGTAGDLLYYVMPFVPGESLRARMDREGQLPIDEAISIAASVAATLDYSHEQGVVHRDIKPENILLAGGEPIVADFGIGRTMAATTEERLTQTGTLPGHAGLHESRTGCGRAEHRRPVGYFLARLRALRDARRRAAIPRPKRASDRGASCAGADAADSRGPGQRVRGGRERGAQVARESAGGSLLQRGGVLRRAQ